ENDVDAGGAQTVEVDDAGDLRVVGGTRVKLLDEPLRLSLGERETLRAAVRASGLDRRFEGVYDLWRGAAGVLWLVLEAVVGARVVRCGDDDGAAGGLIEDGVAGDGGGGSRVEDPGLDA